MSEPRYAVRAEYTGPGDRWTHVDGFVSDSREEAQQCADEWNAVPGNEDRPWSVVELRRSRKRELRARQYRRNGCVAK